METAKLFNTDQSQSVQLPKEVRFEGDRVWVRRIGNAVVLIPYDEPWGSLLASLDHFSDDFMAEREQPPQQQRPEPLG
jgi:antitoxin VapB